MIWEDIFRSQLSCLQAGAKEGRRYSPAPTKMQKRRRRDGGEEMMGLIRLESFSNCCFLPRRHTNTVTARSVSEDDSPIKSAKARTMALQSCGLRQRTANFVLLRSWRRRCRGRVSIKSRFAVFPAKTSSAHARRKDISVRKKLSSRVGSRNCVEKMQAFINRYEKILRLLFRTTDPLLVRLMGLRLSQPMESPLVRRSSRKSGQRVKAFCRRQCRTKNSSRRFTTAKTIRSRGERGIRSTPARLTGRAKGKAKAKAGVDYCAPRSGLSLSE